MEKLEVSQVPPSVEGTLKKPNGSLPKTNIHG
jgi:hypothetical protein